VTYQKYLQSTTADNKDMSPNKVKSLEIWGSQVSCYTCRCFL